MIGTAIVALSKAAVHWTGGRRRGYSRTMPWERVCAAEELPPGARKLHAGAAGNVLVLNVDGRLFGVEDRCPHFGVSLRKAEAAGQVIRCAEHGYKMDLGSGACLTEAGLRMQTYPVEAREGWICVDRALPTRE